jgi:hypothetical protein
VAVAGILLVLGFGLLQLGRAHLAAAQAQTAADLTALAVARELRVSAEPPQPTASRAMERRAAEVTRGSGGRLVSLRLTGDQRQRVEVVVEHPGPLGTMVTARAFSGPQVMSPEGGGDRLWASGGGYTGPLVFRDSRPICPAVAIAFDRMDQAAQRVGVDLVVTSGFRSDAEQAELFRRHPDPRWVAPPGRSRHRHATELDIAGTPGAWVWLSANGQRFGFVQRYSWEPWHWGYVAGCASAERSRGAYLVEGQEGLRATAAKANVALLNDPDSDIAAREVPP